MANEVYSKENVLLESCVTILEADNSDTGNDVREIEYYVADRIYRKHDNSAVLPQLIVKVQASNSDVSIPSNKYILEVMGVYKMDVDYAQTNLNNLMARVDFLINKKPVQMNLVVPSKNLRCRHVNKISALLWDDVVEKVYFSYIRFLVICDDEDV